MTENTTPELTSESTPSEVLEAGLTLVRETLDALYQAHLLTGYAAVIEPDENVSESGAMIVACCAGHAAQSLHPRVTDLSDDPDLKAATAVLEAREILAMFRDGFPGGMPLAGPVERSTDAEDDLKEADGDTFRGFKSDGTGLYL